MCISEAYRRWHVILIAHSFVVVIALANHVTCVFRLWQAYVIKAWNQFSWILLYIFKILIEFTFHTETTTSLHLHISMLMIKTTFNPNGPFPPSSSLCLIRLSYASWLILQQGWTIWARRDSCTETWLRATACESVRGRQKGELEIKDSLFI